MVLSKMREGLRSGKSRERLQKDEGPSRKVLVQKKLFDMVRPVTESIGAESVDVVKIEKLDDLGTCCSKGQGVYEGETDEILEYEKSRKREGGGGGNEHSGRKNRMAKEEVYNGEMQIVGRVLRSRTRPSEYVRDERAEDKSYGLVERITEKNLKQKQGCHPNAGHAAPKRRGRPPLVRETLGISQNQLKKKQNLSGLRKSKRILEAKSKLRQKGPVRGSKRETRSRNSRTSKCSPADVEFKLTEMGVPETPPLQSLEAGHVVTFDEHSGTEIQTSENHGEEAGLTRASEKQLIRDRITELLFAAGWRVDHRPRQGKQYNDAVYVSPDGKTHWSVTLAYRVLKQRYENGDTGAYSEGFIFSPISEEELETLKRVQIKTREGKKRHSVPKGRGKSDRAATMMKKKKKGKLCSAASARINSLVGRQKRKFLQYESDDFDCNRKRRQTQKKKKCALLVRRSDGSESDADGYVLYNGRRSTLTWMIDSGILQERVHVSYMSQSGSQTMLQGEISRNGIVCGCCSEIVTISEFESHAGSKLSRPLESVFLEDGTSMLQCQLDAWNKLESAEKWFHFIDVGGDDPNDDTCGICGDGGDLVCCDGCPSTFHQNCLDIQKFPSGDWYCLYCICKYCGKTEDINERSIEGIQASLFSCSFCEEKYHKTCIHTNDVLTGPFCGRKCEEISGKIEMLLGVKHEIEDGFSWTLVRRCEIGADISSIEVPREIECNSKLAVALLVMDECFLPSSDHRSGINRIHSIVYSCGSNFNRLNYSGFYTITLERGDEIISVACIRIHGNILAEMPYIGTRYMYRRQGMCRRLLTAVESVLQTLNVEKLVIPAISELKDTWTSVFRFEPLETSTKKIMQSMNVIVFPGVDMLQKPILNQFTGENTVHAQGFTTSEGEDHRIANESAKILDGNIVCLEKLDASFASEVTAVNAADETEGKPSAPKSSSQLLNGSSNDLSDITSEIIDCMNCANDMSPSQFGDEPGDILVGKSADEQVLDRESNDSTQAKEIHMSLEAKPDTIHLTLGKYHAQSGATNFGPRSADLMEELDGDFSCDVEVGDTPSSPVVCPRGKDSQEHPTDGDPTNELHDSILLIGSNGSAAMSQWSDDMDEAGKLKADRCFEHISGSESGNEVSPSSNNQVEDLARGVSCTDRHFDCSLSPAASNPDAGLSIVDKMPAMIVPDSVLAVEDGNGSPSRGLD